ncbi:winged helix-turn-helix domain-containing protein [Serratia sp. NFX21]|uniref:winged helix-turn-helix domain-containing protein n=1 Tax=Serratia sp. NFX21 TaxID=3402279 RepID=UPI003AF38105
MSSKIILNHRIIYDKSSGSLKDIEKKYDEIILTTPANNCLLILLNNKPEITTQKELFEEVWEKYGIPINANTLYQNIAMIRKAFRQLGIEDDIIVTIPRRGMLVAETVVITDYVESQDKVTDHGELQVNTTLYDHTPGKPDDLDNKSLHYKIKKIGAVLFSFTLFFSLIAISANCIYQEYLKTKSRLYHYSYWRDYNQCQLYVDDYFRKKVKSNGGGIPFNAELHCDNKERVYISLYVGLPRESFFICDGDILNEGTKCKSRYRYFIES